LASTQMVNSQLVLPQSSKDGLQVAAGLLSGYTVGDEPIRGRDVERAAAACQEKLMLAISPAKLVYSFFDDDNFASSISALGEISTIVGVLLAG
jgi:hypothetical protein